MKLRNRIALWALWWFLPYEYNALRKQAKERIAELMQPPEILEAEFCLPCLIRIHDFVPAPGARFSEGPCEWCEDYGKVFLFRYRDPAKLAGGSQFADWSEDGILSELIEKRRKG